MMKVLLNMYSRILLATDNATNLVHTIHLTTIFFLSVAKTETNKFAPTGILKWLKIGL